MTAKLSSWIISDQYTPASNETPARWHRRAAPDLPPEGAHATSQQTQRQPSWHCHPQHNPSKRPPGRALPSAHKTTRPGPDPGPRPKPRARPGLRPFKPELIHWINPETVLTLPRRAFLQHHKQHNGSTLGTEPNNTNIPNALQVGHSPSAHKTTRPGPDPGPHPKPRARPGLHPSSPALIHRIKSLNAAFTIPPRAPLIPQNGTKGSDALPTSGRRFADRPFSPKPQY